MKLVVGMLFFDFLEGGECGVIVNIGFVVVEDG